MERALAECTQTGEPTMCGKRKILIIMGRYLPGYKDGGPVRSIKNLTDYLGDAYDFYILTCDRDHGDTEPYPNIRVHDWNRVGKARVYYVTPGGFQASVIKDLAKGMDLIYVCGCFSDYAITTLVLKRLKRLNQPVFVASMGLFMPNAMKKKPLKYNSFLKACRLLGLFRNIKWSASTETEAACIQKYADRNAECYTAEDLPRLVDVSPIEKYKAADELKVFFISRISPEKNLHYAIQVLKSCKGNIRFSIYGFIHDKEYWEKCCGEMAQLPANIHAEYKGALDSNKVVETLKTEHVFLFPTIGENYSHVIQEALSAGCPCILSDQTPWKDLEEAGAGYVCELNEMEQFSRAVASYHSMGNEEFKACVDAAHRYAIQKSNENVTKTGYRAIFGFQGTE